MGTSAVVALGVEREVEGVGQALTWTRGVAVAYDGYPANMVPQLKRLFAAAGSAEALFELLDGRVWRGLSETGTNRNQHQVVTEMTDLGGLVTVGEEYTDERFRPVSPENPWQDYTYVLCSLGVFWGGSGGKVGFTTWES